MDGKYSVDTISKYIINYSNEHFGGISNLRLQKLLYFVQVEFIKETGQAAFNEEIEAWSFGPVVPEIYRKYKVFGREDISLAIFNEDDVSNKIKNDDKIIINNVLDKASNKPTAELVRISHIQKPWQDAYAYAKLMGVGIISKESIREYFVG